MGFSLLCGTVSHLWCELIISFVFSTYGLSGVFLRDPLLRTKLGHMLCRHIVLVCLDNTFHRARQLVSTCARVLNFHRFGSFMHPMMKSLSMTFLCFIGLEFPLIKETEKFYPKQRTLKVRKSKGNFFPPLISRYHFCYKKDVRGSNYKEIQNNKTQR